MKDTGNMKKWNGKGWKIEVLGFIFNCSSWMVTQRFWYTLCTWAYMYNVCGCYLVCFSCCPTLLIRCTQQNSCGISENLRRNICKNRIENRTAFHLIMVIGSACSNCIVITIECRTVNNIWRHSLISFKHVSSQCLLFDRHRTTYHSWNRGVRSKKTSHWRPICLSIEASSPS